MNCNNLSFKSIMGNFQPSLPDSQEYLILSFSPSSISLQQRWRNNCLSADFLADYLSTFFIGNDPLQNRARQAEAKSAISYVANELLENGMKYCVKNADLPISVQIHLANEVIIIQLTNSISLEQTRCFQTQISRLLRGNPSEMYLAQLEQNALAENQTHSNLGLLTILNDYDAKIGWQFESLDNPARSMTVTTMVQLSI